MIVILLVAQIAAAPRPNDVTALVARARSARYQQDSTLAEYRATVKQRISFSIGLAKMFGIGVPGRMRLGGRYESVARVGWHHQLGAWGEIIGARSVMPMAGLITSRAEDDGALILPYHPGRDELWPMAELREAMPDHRDWIDHPLESGADSLYIFALGDSLTIRPSAGSIVRLREIQVRPRRPAEKLVVGSLWVDIASGSLVRAAYRPSTPMDLWPLFEREVGSSDQATVKRFGPYTGTVREVVIESGLYEGRFWLPRIRTATGEGTAKGALVSLTIEQTFDYEAVVGLPAGQVTHPAPQIDDTDPRTGRVRYSEYSGVVIEGARCRPTGDSTGAQWSSDSLLVDQRLRVVHSEGVRFRMLLPCDLNLLVSSPALPKSIYAPSEELFSESDFNLLRTQAAAALGMSHQAEWNPQPPLFFYGYDRDLLRYNRVEGLSIGAMVERPLGNGYTASGTARFGLADRQPNADASIRRTNTRSEWQATVYRRLVAANDWENPLGLPASAVAAVFGRDDGFYYRTLGAEVGGSFQRSIGAPTLGWRLFGEREEVATRRTGRSIASMIGGAPFSPNISATTGNVGGVTGLAAMAWGVNPADTRASSLTRIEAATGIGSYGRASTEFTVAHGLGRSMEASVTAAGGTSIGTLTPQRLWYLGGAQTIRGFPAGSATGDAFWFGRAEISRGHPMVRPSVFFDIGWAGSRSSWQTPGRPLSGAGIGAAMLDGLLRFDVARPVSTAGKWRIDFYFEPR